MRKIYYRVIRPLFSICLLLGILSIAKPYLHKAVQKPDTLGDDEYVVEKVVDGDTFICNINGVSEKVRMIGIDTPESVHNDATRNCEYGKVASDFTKDLLEGKIVKLKYDIQKRDKYGRYLAYVYLDDLFVNEKLVEDGYAIAKDFPPNSLYASELRSTQINAQNAGNGMWQESISNELTGGLKEQYRQY